MVGFQEESFSLFILLLEREKSWSLSEVFSERKLFLHNKFIERKMELFVEFWERNFDGCLGEGKFLRIFFQKERGIFIRASNPSRPKWVILLLDHFVISFFQFLIWIWILIQIMKLYFCSVLLNLFKIGFSFYINPLFGCWETRRKWKESMMLQSYVLYCLGFWKNCSGLCFGFSIFLHLHQINPLFGCQE